MKKLSIFLGALAVIVVVSVLSLSTGNVYSATVGQQLTSPEAGWTRYETHTQITDLFLFGSWTTAEGPNSCWSGNYTVCSAFLHASMSFYFTGTNLRLIGAYDTATRSNEISVTIDGSPAYFSAKMGSNMYQVLMYDSGTLTSGRHFVTITNQGAGGSYLEIDALDIKGTLDSLASPSPTPNPTPSSSPTPSPQLCYDYSIEGSLGVFNPGTISPNSQSMQTYTVVGVQLGDLVQVSFDQDLQGITLYGYASANNQITVVFQNRTGNNITLNSGTIQIHTSRHTRS